MIDIPAKSKWPSLHKTPIIIASTRLTHNHLLVKNKPGTTLCPCVSIFTSSELLDFNYLRRLASTAINLGSARISWHMRGKWKASVSVSGEQPGETNCTMALCQVKESFGGFRLICSSVSHIMSEIGGSENTGAFTEEERTWTFTLILTALTTGPIAS